MEIVSRPQPREERPSAAHPATVAAIVLAAGAVARMGGPNKLARGRSAASRWCVAPSRRRTLSRRGPVVVVTGHQAERGARRARRARCRASCTIPITPRGCRPRSGGARRDARRRRRRGGSASPTCRGVTARGDRRPDRGVRAGGGGRSHRRARRATASAAIRCCGRAHSSPNCRPCQGDVGARHLIGENPEAVVEIEIGAAAALDLDTPEAMAAAGGVLAKAASPWTA